MIDNFINTLNQYKELEFIKIYNGFQFKLLSFPISVPIMVVSNNNISAINECKEFSTVSNNLTLTIYSPEKSYDLHISDIAKKVCDVLSDLKYSFKYNGYSHNPIGYLECTINVDTPNLNFINKNDISVFINDFELRFIKNISINSQRQLHPVQSVDNNKPITNIAFNEHYDITIDFLTVQNNDILDMINNLNDFSMTVNYKNTLYIFKLCNWVELTENIDNKNRLIKKIVISSYYKE